jgi:hypothetical protein
MKRTKEEIMGLLALEQRLTATIVGKLGLIWNDEWNVYKFPDNAASFLPYDEYLSVDITPIPFENDYIDAVLFFGDGCIEFHYKEDMDALNWSQFPTEIIEQVLTNLANSRIIGSYYELLAAIDNDKKGEEIVLQATSTARKDIIRNLFLNDNWKLTDNIESSKNKWYLFEKDALTISINDGNDDFYEDIVINFNNVPSYV